MELEIKSHSSFRLSFWHAPPCPRLSPGEHSSVSQAAAEIVRRGDSSRPLPHQLFLDPFETQKLPSSHVSGRETWQARQLDLRPLEHAATERLRSTPNSVSPLNGAERGHCRWSFLRSVTVGSMHLASSKRRIQLTQSSLIF